MRETFILAPPTAPDYVYDRAELWNRVEEIETRKNARLGRDTQLGFAYELPKAEQRKLLEEFVQSEFVARGFVADVAIHDYGKPIPAMGSSDEQQTRLREFAQAGVPFLERDEAKASEEQHLMVVRNKQGDVTGYRLYQPHAHVRITPRAIEDGEWVENKKASRYFNKAETAKNWRYDWPKAQNAYLERIGAEVRVTSTSLEEDAYPDVPRMGTGGDAVTHAIEERAHELGDEERAKHEEAKAREEADQRFREFHNETLRQAFKDEHADTSETEADEREAKRLTAWWRNMSERYNQWRFDFKEHAAEWRTRFEQQKQRMKSALGWHLREEEQDDFEPTHLEASSTIYDPELSGSEPIEPKGPDEPEQER